nr:MAG TPA: antitoxin [Caudoviricetes sp.]
MASIMTTRVSTEMQEILNEQAKKIGIPRNSLVSQILHDWAKENGLLNDK